MHYLRITGSNFGFLTDEIHDIKSTDIQISDEDYFRFFELQKSDHMRLKNNFGDGKTLFDFVEIYIPEVMEIPASTSLDLEKEVLALKNVILTLEEKITNL